LNEQAESAVKQNDKVRIAFVEEFYRILWNAIHAFDLMINTGKITPTYAVNWIVNAANAFINNIMSGNPITTIIEVDRILKEAVSEELKCNLTHGKCHKKIRGL